MFVLKHTRPKCRFARLWFFRRRVVKARANARNIVGQQDATLLGPTCCERLHTMLCVVATCWKLLDEVWNWSNFRANKCQHFYCFAVIEARSNNVALVCTAHPTMLRWRTCIAYLVSIEISKHKCMRTRNQHGVGDGKREEGINRWAASDGKDRGRARS